MAKDTCSKCHGPRELQSPAYSYCIACARRIQRDRYRSDREAAGHVVNPRVIDDTDRRTYLLNSADRPGTCECCGTVVGEPDTLTLEHYSNSVPPDPNDFAGVPFALWCSGCHKLAQSLTSDELRRSVLVFQYLARAKVSHGAVLKDLDWPVTPTRDEQKRSDNGDLQSTPGATI